MAASPNSGGYYMDIMNFSETSATVRTWVYEVVSTISGTPLSWLPTSPVNVRFNLSVIGASNNLYLQNRVESGTVTHRAINNIEATDYIIQSGANVTLRAGNSIILNPGFECQPGAIFEAMSEGSELNCP